MDITRSELDQLLENERKLLDNKAEITAEDVKRDFLKKRLSNYGWWIKWLVIVIIIAWVTFRIQLLESLHPNFSSWFYTHNDDFLTSWPAEKYGYNIGIPGSPDPTISESDVLVKIEFPSVKNVYDVFALGKYVSTPGAYFLKRIIEQKGVIACLRYEHWHGSSDMNVSEFLPRIHVGRSDCDAGDERRISATSMFDYVSVMEVWASKRYAKGHENEFQTVLPAYCEGSTQMHMYTGFGEILYRCYSDPEIAQDNIINGHRKYRLTSRQKRLGIEYKNPWGEFFAFSDPVSLSNNKAVQEYLCSLSPQGSILNILFRHGLVGVATYFTTDIESQADELIEKLIGSYTAPELSETTCTAQRMQGALDTFALVGGVVIGMASAFGNPVTQRLVAGAGLLGGGGAAYAIYSASECRITES